MIMKKLLLILTLVYTISACKDASPYDSYEQAVSDKNVELEPEMSNAIGVEVENKVFKTIATLDLKVNNVLNDSESLEEKAISFEGFVLNSELRNTELDIKEVPISQDSIKREVKIQQTNQLTIKVPTNHLRQYIKFALSKSLMIESIVVDNQEKTFEKLRNDLNTQNSSKQKLEDRIENEVAKAILGDDLKYATINFHLIEEPHLKNYIVPQTKSTIHQEINLGLEIKNAWTEGVYMMKKILVGLIHFLPLALGLLLLYLVFRFLIKYIQKRNTN